MSDNSTAENPTRAGNVTRDGAGVSGPSVSFTVDGRPATAAPGTMLLESLQALGVPIPTLCHHPSLAPSGACRLCVVEITHAAWGGWSGLVTSCLYPVEPGLQVLTRSIRVRQVRRTLLELYLARCPDSDVVKAVARDAGVDKTPFAVTPDADLCIHCGLCTRVCQDLGPAAIAPLGRGTEKLVGPRPDLVGEDCTGCLVCAHICPTGEIQTRHEDGKLVIWNREFPVPLCAVEPELCRGCGVCEEVCPLAIPRVVVHRSGVSVATISPHTCVGCGICAGACPTGAITQQEFTAAHVGGGSLVASGSTASKLRPASDPTASTAPGGGDLRGRAIVYACSRSPFPAGEADLVPVPCIGRVTVEDMLFCLARGADGILLMCRDQATCPYGDGGCQGQQRAGVTEQLARIGGLGAGRVRYVQPAAGLAGPAKAWTEFRAKLAPNPLRQTYPVPYQVPYPVTTALNGGMDLALAVLAWLKSRSELKPALPDFFASWQECTEDQVDALLYLGDLPEKDLLLSLLVPEWRLRDLLRWGVEILYRRGLSFRLAASLQEIAASPAHKVVVFDTSHVPPGGHDLQILTLAELAEGLPDALLSASQLGSNLHHGFKFRIKHEERLEILRALKKASPAPLCTGIDGVVQIKLLTRRGSWREAFYGEPTKSLAVTAPSSTGESPV